MEKASIKEREALANTLEDIAQKVRDESREVVGYNCNQRRPMDTDVDNQRFRPTGLYTFTCSIDLMSQPGEWTHYGDECKEAPKEEDGA